MDFAEVFAIRICMTQSWHLWTFLFIFIQGDAKNDNLVLNAVFVLLFWQEFTQPSYFFPYLCFGIPPYFIETYQRLFFGPQPTVQSAYNFNSYNNNVKC